MAFSVAVSVVKNEFTAADVVQESFVKAFENLKSFKGKSKFSTWFYRIVINEAYKFIQKNKTAFVEEEPELPESTGDSLTSTDQKYFINEVLRIMSPDKSLVLRLFYLNENSLKEISEITGWNESKVKVTLHRARKTMEIKLKDILNHEVESLL
jgi:RNA polymerase sigma-70 factor (ECF subfamily)